MILFFQSSFFLCYYCWLWTFKLEKKITVKEMWSLPTTISSSCLPTRSGKGQSLSSSFVILLSSIILFNSVRIAGPTLTRKKKLLWFFFQKNNNGWKKEKRKKEKTFFANNCIIFIIWIICITKSSISTTFEFKKLMSMFTFMSNTIKEKIYIYFFQNNNAIKKREKKSIQKKKFNLENKKWNK